MQVPPFERWLLSQRAKEGDEGTDPILPAHPSEFDPMLAMELREAGASKADARKLCKSLGEDSLEAEFEICAPPGLPEGARVAFVIRHLTFAGCGGQLNRRPRPPASSCGRQASLMVPVSLRLRMCDGTWRAWDLCV
jgi:hypothetical protein